MATKGRFSLTAETNGWLTAIATSRPRQASRALAISLASPRRRARSKPATSSRPNSTTPYVAKASIGRCSQPECRAKSFTRSKSPVLSSRPAAAAITRLPCSGLLGLAQARQESSRLRDPGYRLSPARRLAADAVEVTACANRANDVTLWGVAGHAESWSDAPSLRTGTTEQHANAGPVIDSTGTPGDRRMIT